jgi:hypothetical protein
MKVLKLVLVVLAVLSLGMVTGCQEELTYDHNLSKTQEFSWEQGQTGFWQPKIDYSYADEKPYQLSQR